MFNRIQRKYNTDRNIEYYENGMIEELTNRQKDMVGNIVFFLIGYCNIKNFSLQTAYMDIGYNFPRNDIKHLDKSMDNLLICPNLRNLSNLLNRLKCFCRSEKINFEQIIEDVWDQI